MTKLDEKFYPLRCEEWAEISGNLTLSELRVLYWLRTKDPYSNGININCAAIARDLSQTKPISRQTVSRAMKTLDRKDYIDLEIISANVKIRSKGVHTHPEVQDGTDGTATHQGYDTVPSGANTHPEVRTHTTGCDTVPSGATSYHPIAETQTEQDFQNPKTLKTNKTLKTSLEESEEEKSEISHQNTPELIANNSSLSKTSGSLQKIEISAASLNIESMHWALDWFGEEFTPWLLEPRSRRNNIIFDGRFMEWHGQRWLEKFPNKKDLYEAIADFRAHLLNYPDKILGLWQQYEASMKHYAGATATAALHGAKIPEKDQKHLMRHQKALLSNTVEELSPNHAIAPEIERKLLPQSVAVGDVGRKLLPQKTTGDLIVEAALRSGELKKVPRGGGFKWFPGFPADVNKFRWFQSAEDWLAEVEKEEVW